MGFAFVFVILPYIFYVSDHVKGNVFEKCIFVCIYLISGDINICYTCILNFYSKTIFRVIYKYFVVYILAQIYKCVNLYTCIHILNIWAFYSSKYIFSRIKINNKIYWLQAVESAWPSPHDLRFFYNWKGEYNLLWVMLTKAFKFFSNMQKYSMYLDISYRKPKSLVSSSVFYTIPHFLQVWIIRSILIITMSIVIEKWKLIFNLYKKYSIRNILYYEKK